MQTEAGIRSFIRVLKQDSVHWCIILHRNCVDIAHGLFIFVPKDIRVTFVWHCDVIILEVF